MAKSNISAVISIEPRDRMIHLYAMNRNDKESIFYETAPYKARPFDKEFYQQFSEVLHQFAQKHPDAQVGNLTVLLPDSVVVTDTISVPAMGAASRNVLNTTVSAMYKNRKELKINLYQAVKTKQYSTYCLAAVRDAITAEIRRICQEQKMPAQRITFAANAAVTGLTMLNPKMKNETYLLLDIKEESARFAFVCHGKVVGFYSLPFGYAILEKHKLAAEDMLFDHSVAELAVLNARERAKAKQLTMMSDVNESALTMGEQTEEDEDAESPEEMPATTEPSDEENEDVAGLRPSGIKVLPKKQPRKLPKFMLRPEPRTERALCYENFRLFMKWSLDLLRNNDKLTQLSPVSAVYVNLPEQFAYVLDMANEEKEENRIEFRSVELSKEPETISRHLELYGAIFARQMNEHGNF